jgi:hypothetical protein
MTVGGIVGETSTTNAIRNCVALNEFVGIRGTTSSVARIVNNINAGVNNFGNSEMSVRNGVNDDGTGGAPKSPLSVGLNLADGADVTESQWTTANWWSTPAPGGPGFDLSPSGPWVWDTARNLPILRGFNE